MTTPFSKTLIAGAVTLLSGGAFAGDGTGRAGHRQLAGRRAAGGV